MEFRQIQYFVCLCEEGSVTRAARRLHIVQPALSMQIAKLEEELGQRLFVRTPQGMQATSEGRRMYQLFLPVLAGYARAQDLMTKGSGELTGQVRVGMIATIAQGVMVDVLQEFLAVHPKVELSLTDGFSGTLIDAVGVGRLDAAVINKPRRPLTLKSEPIAEEELILVHSPRHRAMPERLPFAELARLKLVLPTRQHGLRGIIESFAEAEDVNVAPSVEIDSIGAIVKLVLESDFCTLVPTIAVRKLVEQGFLIAHSVTSPRLTRHVVSVTDARRPPSPATAAFLAMMARHVRGLKAEQGSAPP